MEFTLLSSRASAASTARRATCGVPPTPLRLPSYTNDAAQCTDGNGRSAGRCTFGVDVGRSKRSQ